VRSPCAPALPLLQSCARTCALLQLSAARLFRCTAADCLAPPALPPHPSFRLLCRASVSLQICHPAEPKFGHGACGLWVMLFVASKVPELLDTAFVVLRKRELLFLHWFHHVTVLLFCWHSYSVRASAGLFFAAMNFTVHAVMYGYYALQVGGCRPRWGAAVTALQITQMFAGMAISAATALYQRAGAPCDTPPDNLLAAGAMYSAYAALFVHFAVGRYCGAARGGDEAAEVADAAKGKAAAAVVAAAADKRAA